MAYRNGTYVAFDGQDTTDPTKSDIKYFNMLKGWKEKSNKELQPFNFSDSHKKTSQVRDASSKRTLKLKLLERLKNSKNMILILTGKTRYDREMLNYEIEKAIKLSLPIIVCYTGIKEPILDPEIYSYYWPQALDKGIKDEEAQCLHIPFRKKLILDAIPKFDIHKEKKLRSLAHYTEEAYKFFDVDWNR